MRRWAVKPSRMIGVVLLLAAIVLAELIVNPALADSGRGRWSGHPSSPMGYPLAVATGKITTVAGKTLTLEPVVPWTAGRWHVEMPPMTVTIITDTVVFGNDLAKKTAADLVVDATITATPIPIWGLMQAQWVYLGSLDELADHSYRGNLVEATADTLRLDAPWGDEVTVQVNADTVWVDGGQFGRPAELSANVALQILGLEAEDGTITAVLVTGGYARW